MARSTFSGPVKSNNGFEGNINLTAYAATAIADIADAVNTANKADGTVVWDTTNNKLKIATGSATDDTWVDADGTNAVTPS
jgi:hypothetical protein